MYSISKRVTSILFFFLSAMAISQENTAELCSDGKDNDGDGFIDCYDGDCYDFLPSCNDVNEYLEDTSGCKILIDKAERFDLVEEWRTSNLMYDSRIPLVGDVDNDGKSEVIASNEGVTYIIDGETGQIENQINMGITGTGGLAIADVDKSDGTVQIYFVSGGLLTRLDYNGITFTDKSISSPSSETVNIADFNEDGEAEIYVDGRIFSSDLERRILTLPVASGLGRDFAVAVDVIPESSTCTACGGLEYVAGNTVYAIDIDNGTYSVAASLNDTTLDAGYTAVVDMDLNDTLDIIVADNEHHKVYIWNPLTDTLLGTPYTLSNQTASRTRMGRPNIGDFDNDGFPEIGMATQVGRYFVLDLNSTNALVESASTTINDFSSGFTGSSVYDFEGDGINEIVYRDQDSLRIYRQNGSVLERIGGVACGSLTRHEYPVVVDVDNDNATEILCACANPSRQEASIISVSASNSDWVRARRVWNQHSYFNVNINDDLTVPQYQSKHHLFPNQALNNFLVQSTYVDPVTGKPTSKGRDMKIDTTGAEIIGLCDEDKLIYKYKIINVGNLSIATSTLINYFYQVDGKLDQNIDDGIISFSRNVDRVIHAGDTITQLDTVDFRGVPFNVTVNLNTQTVGANAFTPQNYIFGECNGLPDSDANNAYRNNYVTFNGLDTCKSIQAFNDTITITTNESFEWTSILDNDNINFSITDSEDIKLNFKRYVDDMIVNTLSEADPPAYVSNVISDSTVGEGSVSFTYEPLEFAPIDSILIDSFEYKICHSVISDLCDSAWVFIRYEYTSDIPQGFNASNGGVFEIPNFDLEIFDNSELKVFNRWGNIVYEAKPYTNDWDGTSNNGQELPVGTYFYIFNRNVEGFKVETGFLYLNR